jgi:hypothetical protein
MKLWPSKGLGVLISGVLRLPWNKMIFGCSPLWLIINNTIRRKVVTSPKFRLYESYEYVYACGLSMHQKCSKHALTNLLFGLCRSMWIIDPLIIHPSPHLGAPTCSSTHEVLWVRERTQLLSLFSFSNSHLNLSRSVGVRECHNQGFSVRYF